MAIPSCPLCGDVPFERPSKPYFSAATGGRRQSRDKGFPPGHRAFTVSRVGKSSIQWAAVDPLSPEDEKPVSSDFRNGAARSRSKPCKMNHQRGGQAKFLTGSGEISIHRQGWSACSTMADKKPWCSSWISSRFDPWQHAPEASSQELGALVQHVLTSTSGSLLSLRRDTTLLGAPRRPRSRIFSFHLRS